MKPARTSPKPYRRTGLPERCPRCGQASDGWVFVGGVHLCSPCFHELALDREPVNLAPARIGKESE
jgi:hypothetical protein